MPRPRAADFDDKCRLLLDAGAELFARHGYDRTSINDIARACGMSKTLVYHYYPSKERLLVGIIGRHLADLRQAVDTAARGASPGNRLAAIIHALLEAYRETDALHRIHVNELARLPAAAQDELMSVERRLAATFSEALAEAVPELARSPLLSPVTMSLFGMLNWHSMWFRADGPMTREAYAELVTDLILAGAREVAAPTRRIAAE
ncbi:MAG: TetR family transcriptional regulator [Xanthobacteraceae bacterium]|nr:MAG: TetR family transcriptional regulator [Xanthobacteraceae bacterium]